LKKYIPRQDRFKNKQPQKSDHRVLAPSITGQWAIIDALMETPQEVADTVDHHDEPSEEPALPTTETIEHEQGDIAITTEAMDNTQPYPNTLDAASPSIDLPVR